MNALRWQALGGCALVVACAANRLSGGVVTFQIDPTLSEMHLAGGYATAEGLYVLQETISGSLETQLGGTMLVEVETTPIGFRGGEILALIGGSYQPGPQVANFGYSSSLPPPIGTVLGLLEDFRFSISGDPTPLFNGFQMNGTDFLATGGVFESDKFAPVALAGRLGTDITGNGTVFRNGDDMRIQIPFSFSFDVPVPDQSLTMQVSFVGFLVANGVAPEPASTALLLLGATWIAGRRSRTRSTLRAREPAGHTRKASFAQFELVRRRGGALQSVAPRTSWSK